MTSPRSTVLVLSSDPGFLKVIPASWPSGAEQPEFTLLEHDLNRDLRHDNYDLVVADAVLDPVSGGAPFVALWEALLSTGKPAIVVYPDAGEPLEEERRAQSILVLSRAHSQWAEIAGLLGREMLRRVVAERQARDWERISMAAEAEATLGRYMIEMRHSVNNALTSVLGNAELVAHEPGLPATVQSQASTIRNMALRLNEVFRRFSSIEKELTVAAQESHARGATAGV